MLHTHICAPHFKKMQSPQPQRPVPVKPHVVDRLAFDGPVEQTATRSPQHYVAAQPTPPQGSLYNVFESTADYTQEYNQAVATTAAPLKPTLLAQPSQVSSPYTHAPATQPQPVSTLQLPPQSQQQQHIMPSGPVASSPLKLWPTAGAPSYPYLTAPTAVPIVIAPVTADVNEARATPSANYNLDTIHAGHDEVTRYFLLPIDILRGNQ